MSHATAARRAGLILLLALVVRTGPAAWHRFAADRISTPDTAVYLDLARNLQERGQFRRSTSPGPVSLDNPWPEEVFRTPGYPLFVAAVFRVTHGSLAAVVLLQILMDLLAVALCCWLGTRLFNPAAGAIAALLLAVDAGHAVYANMLMSDVPFGLAVILAFALAVRSARGHGYGTAAAAGAVVSCAAAVRPVGAVAGVPLAIYVWWRGRRKAAVVLLAGSLVFPAAWTLRNYAHTHRVTLASAYEFNVYIVMASKVKARVLGITQAEALDQVVAETGRALAAAGPGGWQPALRRVGGTILRANPGATAAEAGRGLVEMAVAGERRNLLRLFGSERGSERVAAMSQGPRRWSYVLEYFSRTSTMESAVVFGQVIVNTIVEVLALGGLALMLRDRLRPEAFVIGATIAGFFLGSLTVASARMRLPVSFLVALAAAYAIERLSRTFQNARTARTRLG